MRIRHKLTSCICIVCRTRFIAQSAHAKTCTEACRQRLSRQRRKQQKTQRGEPLVPIAPVLRMLVRMQDDVATRPDIDGRQASPSPIARVIRLAPPDGADDCPSSGKRR